MKAIIANLPTGVSIGKIVLRGEDLWRVRLGKKWTGGKSQAKHFKELKDAREWIFGETQKEKTTVPIVALKEVAGTSAFKLSSSQINEAISAFKRLEGQGSLTDAISYYLRYAHPAGGKKTVLEVSTAFLKGKKQAKRDPKYVALLKAIFDEFSEDFGKEQIASIRREAVEIWIQELDFEPVTIGNYVRYLRALFGDAVKRDLTPENPFKHVQPPSSVPGEISVLTPAQAELLLKASRLHSDALAVGVAIKLFAGLRTAELVRLDWSEVGEDQIHIRAKNSKTRQRRLVTIQPNLKPLLLTGRKPSGPVWPDRQDVFHLALADAADGAGVELPQNVLRHTFGSYLFAKLKNENVVAAEMGNSPSVIFAHYRMLVSDADVQAFWHLTPKSIGRQGKASH